MDGPTPPRSTTSADPCTLQVNTLSCIARDREVQFRDCTTPPLEGSTDDMSDKEANKPMIFRCLLLLLPVAIPVVVYLRDIDAMRRIFVTAFVLLLIIVLSCLMVTILRRRRRHLEGQTCNREIARELAHRHFMAMTHRYSTERLEDVESHCPIFTHECPIFTPSPRFLPRPSLPPPTGRCHRDCEFNEENRRAHGHYRPSFTRFPTHYHLASASRSPSPHGNALTAGPLPLLSLHFPRLEVPTREEIQYRCDDPPSYEDAVLCPQETPHRSVRLYPVPPPPETPPPSYEVAVG